MHAQRRHIWLAPVLLAAITLIAYYRAPSLPFVDFDDDAYVFANPVVSKGLTWEGVRWAFRESHGFYWHPLTWLSHMLDVTLFGTDQATGHHLTNLLLHVANTLVLLVALKRLTGTVWRSAIVAALFAVHPLHVESVVWIAERKGLLSTLLMFLAFIAYDRYARRPSGMRYGRVVFCFILGLAAKPMVITLPFVLVLLDYWPLHRLTLDRFGWRRGGKLLLEKLRLFGLTVPAAVLTYKAQQAGGAMTALDHLPLSVRLGNAFVACAAYVGKMFWPVNLAVVYPHPESDLSLWRVAVSLALVLGVTLLYSSDSPTTLFCGRLVVVFGHAGPGDRHRTSRLHCDGGPVHLCSPRRIIHSHCLGCGGHARTPGVDEGQVGQYRRGCYCRRRPCRADLADHRSDPHLERQ
jgi:hypothetical protein